MVGIELIRDIVKLMRDEGVAQLVTPELSLVLGPPVVKPQTLESEPETNIPPDQDPDLYNHGAIPKLPYFAPRT